MGPGMGSKTPGADFQSDPQAKVFSFSGCQTGFFMKDLHGAYFSIARDLRVVVGYCLRTTYHMPYARARHLGIPTASGGVPLNPLETDRI